MNAKPITYAEIAAIEVVPNHNIRVSLNHSQQPENYEARSGISSAQLANGRLFVTEVVSDQTTDPTLVCGVKIEICDAHGYRRLRYDFCVSGVRLEAVGVDTAVLGALVVTHSFATHSCHVTHYEVLDAAGSDRNAKPREAFSYIGIS